MHDIRWQKSTYSGDGSNCVEIALTPTTIHIRDSKTPAGARLAFPPTSWADFIAHAARPEHCGEPLRPRSIRKRVESDLRRGVDAP